MAPFCKCTGPPEFAQVGPGKCKMGCSLAAARGRARGNEAVLNPAVQWQPCFLFALCLVNPEGFHWATEK